MKSKRLKVSLYISAFLHFSAILFLALYEPEPILFVPAMEEEEPIASNDPIEVEYIDNDSKEENKSQSEENKKEIQQIVDQSKKALNNDVDENSRFLSRHNQRVVEETKAAAGETFNNSGGGSLDSKKFQAENGDESKEEKEKTKAISVSSKDGLPTLAQLKPQFDWKQVEDQAFGADPDRKTASQTSDYLKDVDEGVQTLLSTREYVYFSYYERIKTRLNQHWGPTLRQKMIKLFRSGRRIASTGGDRVTQLIIILDSGGILKRIQVVGESGVRDLDEAAIEAFKAAAPFPNPPNGIVEPDGYVRIRWDFVLEA